MGRHTESTTAPRILRSGRTSLVLLVAFAVLILGLLVLERSGSAPVRPLFQNVASTKTATVGGASTAAGSVFTPVVPNSDKKPNKHCDDRGNGGNNGHGRDASVQTTGQSRGNGGGDDGHGKGGGDDRCRPPSGGRGR